MRSGRSGNTSFCYYTLVGATVGLSPEGCGAGEVPRLGSAPPAWCFDPGPGTDPFEVKKGDLYVREALELWAVGEGRNKHQGIYFHRVPF